MPLLLPQDGYDSFITASLNSSDTTIYVNELPTKTAGVLTIYALDGRTISEKIYYTGVASSPNRLTSVTRGLATIDTAGVISFAAVTANQVSHPSNVRIAMTDNIHYLGYAISILKGDQAMANDLDMGTNDIVNAASIQGLDTPTSGETDKGANVDYVNNTAFNGAPDANTTTKGISEIATDAELQAGTATGSTGAPIVATGASFNQVAAANKVPVAKSNAKIDDAWLGLTTAGDLPVSDGTDLQRLAKGTANQVLRTNAAGTALEYGTLMTTAQAATLTDGSNADSLHTHAQIIPSFLSITDAAYGYGYQITSATNSNSVIYVVGGSTSSGGTPFVGRFAKQASGSYICTHEVTSLGGMANTNNSAEGCAVIGSFLYTYHLNAAGSVVTLLRMSAADLTGVTGMTFSGGTPSPGVPFAYTDGTDLYLSDSANTRWKRYSVSGTVATFVENIANTQNGPAWCDGTSVYIASSINTIKKYTLPATLVSTTNHNLGNCNPLASQVLGGMCYGNAGSIFISTTGTIHTNAAQSHFATYITPIDKP